MTENLTNCPVFEEIVALTVKENEGVAKDLIYINVLRALADVVARGWGQVKWIDKTPALVNFYGFCLLIVVRARTRFLVFWRMKFLILLMRFTKIG